MLLATIKRRFTFAIMSMLFLAMFLPLNILPDTAFAQTKPNQCPQGKLCRVTHLISPPVSSTTPNPIHGAPCPQGKLCRLKMPSHPTSSQASSVALNPAQGPGGTNVTGTGSSWTAGDSMLVQWDDGTTLANTTVQSDGTFTVPFTVPSNATQGAHTVYFTDQNAGYFNPATFTVTPNSSSALTVTGVYTRDGNGNVKNTFAPGDAIQYVANVNNSSGNSMTVLFHYQAYGPNNNYIFDSTFTSTISQGASGLYTQGTVPTNAPSGTYTIPISATDQNNPQNQGTAQGQFTVATPAYNAGNYGGKSGSVHVGSYNEPNQYAYRNYCGPGASRVLISAWTNNVPTLQALATAEKTNPNSGTLMQNMIGPINRHIGHNYYSIHYASSQGDFSNMIGLDILDHNHPLITGILTIYGTNHLNGWKQIVAYHIITIYGFDFSSPTVGYIYYYETGGTVAGTTSTGRNTIDYNTFWSLVQQNNIQLS